jgi:hypothetical protein
MHWWKLRSPLANEQKMNYTKAGEPMERTFTKSECCMGFVALVSCGDCNLIEIQIFIRAKDRCSTIPGRTECILDVTPSGV